MRYATDRIRELGAVIHVEFLAATRYRTNLVIQLIGSLMTVVVLLFFWRAVFFARATIEGLDWPFMLRYVILVQFIICATQPTNIARELSDKVRDGSLATQIVRPFGLLWYLVCRILAAIVWQLLWIGAPLVLIGFSLRLGPETPTYLVLLPISLVLAFLMNTAVEITIGLAAFWFRRNEGIIHARDFLFSLFSGALLPLVLFPGPLQRVLDFLPFKASIDVPVGFYLGYSHPVALLYQGIWALIAWAVCWLVFRRALRRFDALGG
ncbi:ABC-2 family transporter protein [Candidatus Bipolaricaulota bacterium]|nr:ABC-2 family transporter protein [Candidatus Bipolaricaulota bacterium]